MPRFVCLMLHWLDLADHPDPWSGPTGDYFISDRDITCAYLASIFPPKYVEILSKNFGFTIVAKIQGCSFMISRDYVEEVIGNRVVRRGKDFITWLVYSAVWERELRNAIIRDASDCGYWIASGVPVRGYREYFCRISPDEFASLSSHLQRDHNGLPVVAPPDEDTLRNARSVRRPLSIDG